jgi:hypothetical protein
MTPNRVTLSNNVAYVLVNAAIQGYEASYKQERLGILLGRIQRNVAIVERATLYRGGDRTRSAAIVNGDRFTKRVRQLSTKHDSLFLGTFHTHNEIGGTISSAMSLEDRNHLCENPPHLVELIVAVWRSDLSSRPTQRYLQGDVGGYRFRIAGYQMYSPYNLIPVYSQDGN